MKNLIEQNSNASESTIHVVGETFWISNPRIRYSLIDGRVWQAGDPPYDDCRQDADSVTYFYRGQEAR